jgi:tRNA(fMet)-specific endonuclease VapC
MADRPIFALDSNSLIHALKGAGRVRQRLLACDPTLVAVPSVVAFEIEYGTLKSANPERRRRELRLLLNTVRILPFDLEAAEIAAGLRVHLEQRGETIGQMDFMIAATAVSSGCVLVTHNTAEFGRVPGLQTEDWY